ncbi:Holliday junction branch migration protein RuvA [Patescibacteria group bacterium]|nr:Holliday junction branch migration protein RuvA [Patescibacteria group bacterium]MBU0964517.1 Holliday junction branch migration protein RuvA [Patescibacteria group bacterium]
MISYVSGIIKVITKRSVVLETNGVGYEIYVLPLVLEKAKSGEELSLFTHMHVREDAMELYGFADMEQRIFFQDLISVSGVGPKSAVTIMSLAPLPDLKKAIVQEDASLLTKVSGIGKKTAERLILELRNKLTVSEEDKIDSSSAGTSDSQSIDGLISLGYSAGEAREALRQVDKDITEVKDRIKAALKMLGKK